MAFFSISQLPKVNNGAYVINLDDKKSKGKNPISIFIVRNTVAYFDSFGVEHIPQEVLNKTKHRGVGWRGLTINKKLKWIHTKAKKK